MEWKDLYDRWREVSKEEKREIERLFMEKEERLEELFRREPFARRVYVEKVLPLLEKVPSEEEWAAEKEKLRDYFEGKLREAKIDPRVYMRGPWGPVAELRPHGFLNTFKLAREMYATLPRREAFKKTKGRIKVLIDDIISVVKPELVPPPRVRRPPRVAPPRVVPVEVPRRPRVTTKTCWICGRTFETDLDLERRLRRSEILGFPALWYELCPEHKERGGVYKGMSLPKWGYRSVEDAVAYQLVEGRSMAWKKTGLKGTLKILTEDHLREIGLTEEDIKRIRIAMYRWLPPEERK